MFLVGGIWRGLGFAARNILPVAAALAVAAALIGSLEHASLVACDFRGADLRGARLDGATLRLCRFDPTVNHLPKESP